MQWLSRLLGIAMALFLGIFALDAFDGGPFLQVVMGFALHLIPAAIVLATVAAAWRREWIGAVLFTGLGVAYAVTAREHLPWIAAISGPLWTIGLLYAFTWMRKQAPR